MKLMTFFTKKTKSQNNEDQENGFRERPSQVSSPWIIWGICLFFALLFLFIASKSSPLYPINDWTDANTFFTVGKGMMNGKVPYLDLFEQKGPLLYLIYGLGYLISHTTFLGVFIFEVLSFSVFLYFCHRLVALFVGQSYSLIGLPLLTAAVLNMRSFGHGGSAEQFTLPLIAISLYYFVLYFKSLYPQPAPASWLLINGFLAGCVLWIKYSFVGLWIGMILSILLSLLVNKNYKEAIKATANFLAGVILATLPWIVYFAWHSAIREWFQAYFIINLTSYPMDLTLRERVMVPIDSLQRHLSLNPAAVSLLILGMIVFITNKKFLKDVFSRLGLLVGAALLTFGVYGGGRDYVYYFFIFSSLISFGFIVLLHLYAEEYGQIRSTLVIILFLSLSLIGSLGYTLRFQRNVYMLKWDHAAQIQYRYADIINKSDNPTLLNYGFQDSGFFTASGITPNIRFFQKYNIEYGRYPLATDEQNRYIEDQTVDFVVIRLDASDDPEGLAIPNLFENYQLIASDAQLFGETEFRYLLFEKKR
jgi:hypothetical protein